MLTIDLQGEKIDLLPERALWWERESTLIVADLHWGKTAHFRKNGIAIPAQSQNKDEMRLAQLLQSTRAERLIIAGDLFHSRSNQQVDLFTHFRNHHQTLQVDLVIGNHDILKKEEYARFHLSLHQECLTIEPFCIAHDHLASSHFVIHGHVHPAMRIKSKGNNQAAFKLCCFAVQEDRMILPAFGEFTGTHLVDAAEQKHIYLIAEDKVIQWK
jgi:DNA ligase-associated metallophosphoesterase